MFPEHRIFASSKQIEQAVNYLCSGWKANSTGGSKCVVCAFSAARRRKIKNDDATNVTK